MNANICLSERNTANAIPTKTDFVTTPGTYRGEWIGFWLYENSDFNNVHIFDKEGHEYNIAPLLNVDDSRLHYFRIYKVIVDSGFNTVMGLLSANV